ncbi:MAG: hypothetical protein HG422_08395 [Prevotella sp.]|nr:hypothetical protein [Prevotella sp.]
MENETKVCAKCKRTLPYNMFWKNNSAPDGLYSYCKECCSTIKKKQREEKKLRQGGNLKKIYSDPELARFTPRQLIAELRTRGYSGELKYTQIIKL